MIFISYRRADSQHAAFAIADRLRWAFGAQSVFFDRGSIRAGNEWPVSLRQGLESAKVLVVVVGKSWLTTYDDWGRRRIDDPGDWVRCELSTGLRTLQRGDFAIVPVLLDGAKRLRREALDASLQRFADIEPKQLQDVTWEDDLESLIQTIAASSRLPRISRGERNPNGSPARPKRTQSERTPLSDADVRALLEPLPRWQLQWGAHPWGVGGQAQEITKSYDFDTFTDAMDFMAYAAKTIDAWNPPHHPRWENQWKVVNVSFSTWDVDCRITELDIDAANKLDKLYSAWNRGSRHELL